MLYIHISIEQKAAAPGGGNADVIKIQHRGLWMLLNGIFWTNIKKHGFIKGTLGGYLMYPSFPMFVLFEKILLKHLNRIVAIFNVPALDIDDFKDYGRVNLQEYSWFDRMNCHFCAYANGVGHMVSETLDIIGKQKIDALSDAEKAQVQKLMHRTFNIAKPIGLFSYFVFVITISGLLNYDKPYKEEIIKNLRKTGYAKGLRSDTFKTLFPDTFKLRFLFRAFEHTLSIIESNWCPLTYANKKWMLKHQESFVSTGYDAMVVHVMNEAKDRNL